MPSKRGSTCLQNASARLGWAGSAALVVAVLMAAGTAACRKTDPQSQAQKALAVRTAKVRSGSIKELVRYVGTVHSREEIKVLARVAGRVAALPVAEGKQAKRGKAVAVIAAPEMSARVSRVYAEVARAREESAFLCQQAKTDEKLLRSHVIPRIKADASRQKCISSKAALRAVKASLKELRAVRGKTVERAPFDGTVLKWLAQPGENAMPGRPILIFGGKALEVRVLVHEKDVEAGIHKGTAVLLRLGGKDEVRAAVAQVAPMAAGPGRMFEVRIPLTKEQSGSLRHGMSLDLAFVLHEAEKATSVPALAVTQRDSATGVYVVRKDRTRWVPVTTSYREGEWVAVEGKLSPGDQVVVGNLDAVQSGMLVYPVLGKTHEK